MQSTWWFTQKNTYDLLTENKLFSTLHTLQEKFKIVRHQCNLPASVQLSNPNGFFYVLL